MKSLIFVLFFSFFAAVIEAQEVVRPQPAVMKSVSTEFGVKDIADLGSLVKRQLSKAGIKNPARRVYLISMVKQLVQNFESKAADELVFNHHDIKEIVGKPATVGELLENITCALRLMDRIIKRKHWRTFRSLAALFEVVRPALHFFKMVLVEREFDCDASVEILSQPLDQDVDSAANEAPDHTLFEKNTIIALNVTVCSFVIAGFYFPLVLPSLTKGMLIGVAGGAVSSFAMEGLWKKSPRAVVKKKMVEGGVYGGLSGVTGGVFTAVVPGGYVDLSQQNAVAVENAVKGSVVSGFVAYLKNLGLTNPLKNACKEGLKGGLKNGLKCVALNVTKPIRTLVASLVLKK